MIAVAFSIAALFVVLVLICAFALARASALEEDAKDNEIDFGLEEWKWPHL